MTVVEILNKRFERTKDIAKVVVEFKIVWEDELNIRNRVKEIVKDVYDEMEKDVDEKTIEILADQIDINTIKHEFKKMLVKELSVDFKVVSNDTTYTIIEELEIDDDEKIDEERLIYEAIVLVEAIVKDTFYNVVASLIPKVESKELGESKTNRNFETETKEGNRTEIETGQKIFGVRKLQVTRDDARICIPIDYLRMLYFKYGKVPAKFKISMENDKLILEPVFETTLDDEKLLKLRILNL